MLAKSPLQTDLDRTGRELGADLIGFADLKIAQDFVCKQGGEHLRRFPRAISIGTRLLDAIVEDLHKHEDRMAIYTYKALYNSVNLLLDRIGLSLAKKIQDEGYQAYAVPASQRIDLTKLAGVFSHKLAANLAGLGWIGKSCLLITPSYGPRIRFSTVLTDAPLRTDSPINRGCKGCRQCVDICPVKAFTDMPFDPSEPREVRFNANLCDEYSQKREEKLGVDLCSLCVFVCPFGRARTR